MSKQQEFFTAVSAFVKKHCLTLTLSLCGVALAILFLWIGFWKTVLIVALGAVGGAFGFWLDKRRTTQSQDGYLFFDDRDA